MNPPIGLSSTGSSGVLVARQILDVHYVRATARETFRGCSPVAPRHHVTTVGHRRGGDAEAASAVTALVRCFGVLRSEPRVIGNFGAGGKDACIVALHFTMPGVGPRSSQSSPRRGRHPPTRPARLPIRDNSALSLPSPSRPRKSVRRPPTGRARMLHSVASVPWSRNPSPHLGRAFGSVLIERFFEGSSLRV